MKPFYETVMAPATGWADVVKTGQRLRVTDLEGLQVVDMAVFNAHNVREKLSTSYSRSRAGIAGEGRLSSARPSFRGRSADVDHQQ